MKPRQKCEICGAGLSGDRMKYLNQYRGGRHICSSCSRKERAEAIADRCAKLKEEFEQSAFCTICGAPIAWKSSYVRKPKSSWPKTCCPTCHAKYAKRNVTYTKEMLVEKISAFIKARGEYTSYVDVIKGCHLKTTLLKKFNISVLALNKEILGMSISRFSAGDKVGCARGTDLKEICAAYGLSPCTSVVVDAYKEAKRLRLSKAQKVALLTALAEHYIQDKGRYVGIVEFVRALGSSYDIIVQHYGINMPALNTALGFMPKRGSWYEAVAYKLLLDTLPSDADISREHSFDDCRSSKGWRLRFDFFLPAYNTLIEVDGEQHKAEDVRHTVKLAENDSIKDAFAASHGYRLLRIDTKPRLTFESRFQELILEVIKPIELLEPLPGKAGGNQQPSHGRRLMEGSETTEMRSKVG